MRRNFIKLVVLGTFLAVPLFSIAPAQAQATRTWVSGVGDDVNPCSRTAPCKTFAGAISKTAANGEINCLDPAGFGAVTITKSMTIDCTGTFGSILNANTNGINVSTTASMRVTLRGLSIQGAGIGINAINVTAPSANVLIEHVVIEGQTGNGVVVTNASGVTQLFINDVTVTEAARGVHLAPTGTGVSTATISRAQVYATTISGFETAANSTFMWVDNSMISGIGTGNGVSTSAGNGQISIANSMIVNNNVGIRVGAAGSTVRFTNNKILTNNTSTQIVAGSLISGGDNKLDPAGVAPSGTLTTQ